MLFQGAMACGSAIVRWVVFFDISLGELSSVIEQCSPRYPEVKVHADSPQSLFEM